MFEKEAEKKYCNGCKWRIEQCLWAWRQTNGLKEPNEKNCSCKEVPAYLAGAEFGYNKANEWHYVKDELPELYKDVLVVFPQGNCDVKRLTNHNEWVGRGSWCSLTDVIAWKEIVLP